MKGSTIKAEKTITEKIIGDVVSNQQVTFKHLIVIWLQQFTVITVISVIASVVKSKVDYSVLVGGMIYLLPNIYLALYAFRLKGTQAAEHLLMSFYRGEMGKFLLSGVGFAVAFTLIKPLDVFLLFSTYIALIIIQSIQLAAIKYD